MEAPAMAHTQVETKGLDRRLEAAAWGLFFIMLGGILFLPSAIVPQGTWLIGAGLIMLVLNAARAHNGIRTSPFSIGLGVVAVVAGLADFAGLGLPILPLILMLIGVEIIFKAARGYGR
jgi:hypothetical protein